MIRFTSLLVVLMTPFVQTLPVRADADTTTVARQASDFFAGAWVLYKSRFVDAWGRVADDGNGGISHSEGQGSAMLFAASADDRPGFDLLWRWTGANLMVRSDALAAWKWVPDAPHVPDTNNASDGDLLIAWGLARAYTRWNDEAYAVAARSILADLDREAIVRRGGLSLLLPGATGFAADDRPDGPVVNLSYWIFPAFDELARIAPDFPAADLIDSGRSLIKRASLSYAELPPDWLALAGKSPRPAAGFLPRFSYDAIRIPLYLAWYDPNSTLLAPFVRAWSSRTMHVVSLPDGHAAEAFAEPGYRAVADLVLCAAAGNPVAGAEDFALTQYYPSMLGMLSLLAMAERYPQCLAAVSH